MKMVDEYCKGCIYQSKAWGCSVCNYFLHTKIRRPCKAGKGCTVRTKGKKKRVGLIDSTT